MASNDLTKVSFPKSFNFFKVLFKSAILLYCTIFTHSSFNKIAHSNLFGNNYWGIRYFLYIRRDLWWSSTQFLQCNFFKRILSFLALLHLRLRCHHILWGWLIKGEKFTLISLDFLGNLGKWVFLNLLLAIRFIKFRSCSIWKFSNKCLISLKPSLIYTRWTIFIVGNWCIWINFLSFKSWSGLTLIIMWINLVIEDPIIL